MLSQRPSGVLLLLFLLTGCTGTTDPASATDSEISIGVPEGNSESKDVGVRQLARTIALEGLTQLSAEGRAMPRLAESWTWGNGERNLRIRLRDNITLHDGRRLDAQTVAEALAITIAEGSADSYPALGDVRGAIPQSQRDLLLELKDRSPSLPADLTVLLDIPAGPYQIVKEEEGVTELERFDKYYQGVPSIQRIKLRRFDTLRTSWASLLRHELDVVYDVPVDTVDLIRNDDIDVVSVPRWYQHLVAFNVHDPRFKSAQVRKALNMAVDRNAIIQKVLAGAGTPSAGPIYPKYWSVDANPPAFAFDPQGAIALLEAAGYRLSKTAGTDGPPARLRFTCLVPRDFTVWQKIALEVQKDLSNIGVDMQLKVVELDDEQALVGKSQFQAAFINMISGPTPARPYMWWRSARVSKGLYNVFGYENGEAERAFGVLLRSTNDVAVRTATSQLQRVFYEDPPAIFVAWDTRNRAVSRRLEVPNDGRDPMWTLWRWTVKSPREVALAR